MRDFQKGSGLKEKLLMLAGVLLGGGSMLLIFSSLPIAKTVLVSSVVLASLIVACAYISKPALWWMSVGAIAGILIGIGGVMAGHLAQEKEPLELDLRLTFVAFQSIAGLIAGVVLGRKIHQDHLPTLREFLSSLSALTVGLFAVIVTIRFVVDGLEPARSLSSRLSVSTTILITLIAVPGALGYFLAKHRPKPSSRHASNLHERRDR
jgi:hypothetical protein